MSKIIGFEATNFKRLKLVNISPTGHVVLGGNNAQGKSSVLDAVTAALFGAKAIPAEPVRHGESEATIKVQLDDGVVVERTIKPDGKHRIKVVAGEMSPQQPQRWLDERLASITFDPLSFLGEKPQQQAALLRQVAGIDTSKLDHERKRVFDDRTEVNREVARLASVIKDKEASIPSDTPDQKVSVDALMQEFEKARAEVEEHEKRQRVLESLRRRHEAIQGQITEWKRLIANAEAELEEVRLDGKALGETIKGFVAPPIEQLRGQIAAASSVNTAVAAKQDLATLKVKHREMVSASESYTQAIAAIDEAKERALLSAKWPVPGLSVDDEGVRFNGVPLQQCSQAEQLRVTVALAAAANPEIKVALVREGCRLDGESLKLLLDACSGAGVQAWVERVGKGDAGAVIIEDGEVE